MILTFRCDNCKAKIRVHDRFAGAKLKCQHCGNAVVVPAKSPPVAAPVPLATPAPQPPMAAPVPKRSIMRWFSPSITAYGKKYGFIWGVLLAGGALLPVLVPDGTGDYGLKSLNFEYLGEPLLPGTFKFLLLYPLLAGLAGALIARYAHGYARAIPLIAVGLFPWIVTLPTDLSTLGPFVASFQHVIYYCYGLALLLLGLFVGLRIQMARPGSLFARLTAGISGAVLLLMVALPVLPAGKIAFLIPFDLMNTGTSAGMLALLALACAMAVAVIGCMSFPNHPGRNQRLATVGVWILFAALVAFPLIGAGALSRQGYKAGAINFSMAFMVLPFHWAMKYELWAYGLLALMACGIIDCYVIASRQWDSRGTGVGLPPAQGRVATTESEPVVPGSSATLPSTDGSLRSKLEELNDLRSRGLISQEEFDSRRKALLGGMLGD